MCVCVCVCVCVRACLAKPAHKLPEPEPDIKPLVCEMCTSVSSDPPMEDGDVVLPVYEGRGECESEGEGMSTSKRECEGVSVVSMGHAEVHRMDKEKEGGQSPSEEPSLETDWLGTRAGWLYAELMGQVWVELREKPGVPHAEAHMRVGPWSVVRSWRSCSLWVF